VKFRTPANVLLRRAQFTLILAALLPTILMTPIAVVLLVVGSSSAVTVVSAVLILGFITSALTGYILGSILVSRGASLAKVQNDFLSGVSHELTTPITSVRMFVDTLRADRVTEPAERARCLAVIDREMSRLETLVTKLISLSKLESGRQPFEHTAVDMRDVVGEALTTLDALRLNRPGDEVAVEAPAGLEVTGDRAWLAQALANLLLNAWKYAPDEGKRITVIARAAGKRHVELEVADNGPGVPENERERIFEQFERGHAATVTHAPGQGLGLAIARAIVRQHGGRLWVHASPTGGAAFVITLPRRGFALRAPAASEVAT
jgi:two-component system phosphate regulon sensor histidine kinase PhoR